jgi:hypothetical protein
MPWYAISGGGGTSTGGTYSLSGTIGQPATATLAGGNFAVVGGFWSIFSVVQTPGSPTLTLTRSGANVILSWPASAPGFNLQENTSVKQTGGWSAVGQSVVLANGTNFVTVPISAGNLFFRLTYP